ncbi:MAG: sodium:alanine symporter family protein [Ruminococcaceae bacterium]|nr:sodium:alanine symporter family protein [Oscillospiraceae bacterium]
MNTLNNITGALSVLMIFVFGVYLSFKTKFFQFLGLKNAFKTLIKDLFSHKNSTNGVSSKGAMCTALAATIGTGNIVGVSGAIALCGAGVVFWLVVSSAFAMIIKYTEIYIAVYFKKSMQNGFVGGTMYAVKYGLPKRFLPLGVCFSALLLLASLGTGNLIQINTSLSGLLNIFPKNFKFSLEVSVCFSLITAVFIGFLLLSGIDSVAKTCEKTIPFLLLFYTASSLAVILLNFDRLPQVLAMILEGAFTPKAVTGGAVTSLFLTLKTGIVRGIVSNEAGMGSATVAHAVSNNKNPKTEGELGIAEVFIDTAVCLLTALVILLGNKEITYGTDTGLLLALSGFENTFGAISKYILAIFLMLFGISSVLGWGAYGTVAAEFLYGKTGGLVYKFLFSAACVLCPLISVDKIWSFSEILNSIMSIPNVIAVFLLFKGFKNITK